MGVTKVSTLGSRHIYRGTPFCVPLAAGAYIGVRFQGVPLAAGPAGGSYNQVAFFLNETRERFVRSGL